MHAPGYRDPFAFDVAEGFFHLAKEAARSRERKRQRAELAKAAVPFIDNDAFLGRKYLCQDIPEAIGTMWWKGDCHVDCVNYLSQKKFAGGP